MLGLKSENQLNHWSLYVHVKLLSMGEGDILLCHEIRQLIIISDQSYVKQAAIVTLSTDHISTNHGLFNHIRQLHPYVPLPSTQFLGVNVNLEKLRCFTELTSVTNRQTDHTVSSVAVTHI